MQLVPLFIGEEVQWVPEPCPAFTTRGQEAQVVQCDTSAVRRFDYLATYKPDGVNPPECADYPDVVPAGASQVLIQLDSESAGASDCSSCGINEYGRSHLFPSFRGSLEGEEA
jgi:hypothetical protein